MDAFWHDVKFGARMLLKNRGVTVIAVLALALGIGANTAIFSVVNAVLLRPLPYPEADRLVFLTEWSEQVQNMSFSVANFKDVRDQSSVFQSVGAFRSANYIMTGSGDPERLNGRQVSADFFPTMQVQPILGRIFTADEDKPGAERVALLGEGFWTRRFAGDPNILGQQLNLNGESFTVIGVLPGTFHGTWRQADVWTSLLTLEDQIGGPQRRGSHPGIYVVGRLNPGVDEEQGRTEVVSIAKRLSEEYPQSSANQSMTLRSLHSAVVDDLEQPLWVLLGAVAFVLLIACANVANLLLARGAVRQREIAIRTALGAGRIRIFRQLLTESVMLALVGGAAGMAVAYGGVRGLMAITPENTPRMNEVQLDGAVLAFTAVLALVTGILFGLIPAWQTSRPDVHEVLKEGGRSGSAGKSRHRLRNALVVAEVALSLILLVGAGLLLKSFYRLLQADGGFNPQGVLTATVSAPQTKYSEPALVRNFIEQVVERVSALPGVEHAGSALPLLGGWQTGFWVEGRPFPPPGQFPSTDITRISPDYFRAMGVRLLKGRHFTEQDHADAQPVCIIDETFVRAYWPEEEPIGKKVRFGGPDSQNPWMEVVGVVAHVKNYGVDEDSRVETYVPYKQNPIPFFTLVIRTGVNPESLAGAVRDAVRSVDAEVPLFNVRTLESIVADSVTERRLAALLLGVFAGLALLLAAVGIYGVMSYSVSQRTHEIGIRMALGAARGDIVGLVVRQGMLLAVVGVLIGLGVTYFWLSRTMDALMFETSSRDVLTYVGVPLVLAVVALIACYVPARRATRVDPLVALRYE